MNTIETNSGSRDGQTGNCGDSNDGTWHCNTCGYECSTNQFQDYGDPSPPCPECGDDLHLDDSESET